MLGCMPNLSRRATLLLPLALTAAGQGGWVEALAQRGPGLLLSYDVQAGDAFDRTHGNCAYTYDNAAAGLALLAAGRVAEAQALGDALVQAQSRDRFWHDGRLRNAYAAGVVAARGPYPLPGWWDEGARVWREDAYQVGTATGVVAWAMLLWLALARATGGTRFTEAAARAGDWVNRTVRVGRGYGGGFIGWEPGPERVGWISIEHNLDLSVAFAWLGQQERAAHARAFVVSMWDRAAGRFMTGLRPDGTTNPHPAADANLWPLLAPAPAPGWASVLDWVLTQQGVREGQAQGIDFDDDRDGIWLEGTAYAALAAKFAGRARLAGALLETIIRNTTADGLVWASTVPRLTTGLSTGLSDAADFTYFRRPHVGATAWAVLASLGTSPFRL